MFNRLSNRQCFNHFAQLHFNCVYSLVFHKANNFSFGNFTVPDPWCDKRVNRDSHSGNPWLTVMSDARVSRENGLFCGFLSLNWGKYATCYSINVCLKTPYDIPCQYYLMLLDMPQFNIDVGECVTFFNRWTTHRHQRIGYILHHSCTPIVLLAHQMACDRQVKDGKSTKHLMSSVLQISPMSQENLLHRRWQCTTVYLEGYL